MCLPQIVRGSSAGFTSASQAAAYQAFMGKGFVIGLTPAAYVCAMYTIAERKNRSRSDLAYLITYFFDDVYINNQQSFPA